MTLTMKKAHLLSAMAICLFATTFYGCDDDESSYRPEDASIKEITQDFDGICSVTLEMQERGNVWWNYYPQPRDYTPYAAFESDMHPMFFIYIRNTSNATIKVSYPDFVLDYGNKYFGLTDLPDDALHNFFAVYRVSDNSLADNLIGYCSTKELYIEPGSREIYYESDRPDVEAGTQWGRAGAFDVKVKYDMTATIYDGAYKVNDNQISGNAQIAKEVTMPVDMTMRMVCLPAPERKPAAME